MSLDVEMVELVEVSVDQAQVPFCKWYQENGLALSY